jgi:hypothetical protein
MSRGLGVRMLGSSLLAVFKSPLLAEAGSMRNMQSHPPAKHCGPIRFVAIDVFDDADLGTLAGEECRAAILMAPSQQSACMEAPPHASRLCLSLTPVA